GMRDVLPRKESEEDEQEAAAQRAGEHDGARLVDAATSQEAAQDGESVGVRRGGRRRREGGRFLAETDLGQVEVEVVGGYRLLLLGGRLQGRLDERGALGAADHAPSVVIGNDTLLAAFGIGAADQDRHVDSLWSAVA